MEKEKLKKNIFSFLIYQGWEIYQVWQENDGKHFRKITKKRCAEDLSEYIFKRLNAPSKTKNM
jgi:hypothetical protein